jgi:dihydrofolate reductase
MAHFRELTRGHPVIMGRATWASLPARFRPLPGRDNIVLTRTVGFEAAGALVAHGIDEALRLVGDRDAWVIGGGEVYTALLPRADRVEVTVVSLDVGGDTRAPALDPSTWRRSAADPDRGWHVSAAGGTRYRFETYLRA